MQSQGLLRIHDVKNSSPFKKEGTKKFDFSYCLPVKNVQKIAYCVLLVIIHHQRIEELSWGALLFTIWCHFRHIFTVHSGRVHKGGGDKTVPKRLEGCSMDMLPHMVKE